MNDVVVKSGATRLLHLRTAVGPPDGSGDGDADEVATYAADGVIVAAPTGSTSYSLSAGGPLVHPRAPVLLITPICPHTLNARSLIVPDTETVHLRVTEQDPRDTALVTVDGQIEVALRPGDAVEVSRAPFSARLLSVGGPNFYQKLRARWRYGERLQG
jgi:NAD+ kinase